MNKYINPVERMRLIAWDGGDGEWVIREGEGVDKLYGRRAGKAGCPFLLMLRN